MQKKTTLVTGALAGFLSVLIGAFGAHALKATLTASGRTETFETAVKYQFYHALALILTALLMRTNPSKLLGYAAGCFTGGILVFSGSLYVLCLSGRTILGAVTPLGGVLFMTGWLLLARSAYSENS